jgi:prepilin signal peptidase PulO-like enzyme (type II secretory pathway)
MHCLLIAIAIYDYHHKIIPDLFVFVFAGIALATMIAQYQLGNAAVYDLLAGPLLAAPFALLWLVSKGRWIGFGDAKLALGIGAMLGLVLGVSAIVISFWLGAGVALLLMARRKNKLGMKSEIPFGPFMIAATFLTFLFQFDVFGLRIIFSAVGI